MKGEWCYFKSYISKDDCDRIIEVVKTRPQKEAKMGVDGSTERESYRKSKTTFISKGDAELGFMFDELWKKAIVANSEWFNFHITKLDYMQAAEYESANRGEYKTHHDVFYMNNDPVYHRKLSCIVQLSDPETYEGGDLELYEISSKPNQEDMRQQGTVIFFPSFVRHAALPVTEGTRYSLAAWFDGPKWR